MTRNNTVFKVFSSRNYSLYFGGQGLSMTGDWITKTTAIWLIYQLTNSALLLGVAAFFSLSPTILFSPIGGLIADKKNRHKILVLSQIISALKSLALAIFAFTGHLSIWVLLILTFIHSLIEAIENPTRQAFIPNLIADQSLYTSAIALNSIMASASRLIGPAIAGILIARVGASFCFLIDSASYIVILGCLLLMRDFEVPKSAPIKNPWKDIKEGFTYVYGHVPIRTILLSFAGVNLLATPIVTIGPIFAGEILQGDAETFGLFMTATGVGGVLGALVLSFKKSVQGLDTFILVSPALTGLCLILFAKSKILNLSLLALLVLGFLLIIQISATNTLLQVLVTEDQRGRLMSLFMIIRGTMLPLGNLFAGVVADVVNAPLALFIEGGLCIVSVLYLVPQHAKIRNAIQHIKS